MTTKHQLWYIYLIECFHKKLQQLQQPFFNYRYAGFIFYLAAVLHPLGAVHYYVDFGVGSSTSDVACHNLNFVHNACRIVTRPVNSLSASNGSLLSVLL